MRFVKTSLIVPLVLLAPMAFAQPPAGKVAASTPVAATGAKSPRIALMIAEWTRARDWTREYIAAMPEEHFAFKPVPVVRTFAEQMLHLAYWNFGFTAQGFGRKSPYTEEELMSGNFKTKAGLTRVVMESYDFVIAGLNGLAENRLNDSLTMRDGRKEMRIERINDAYEHQTHHRGQTVAYLRLNGVTPPPEPF